ncbi:MAG: flagellar hook-basal body complex protein FliE [Leptospiraceae bacterium]|nr:flagellar hook-basal body complex protein FliE [Leptospiraceae bacterium]
MLDKIKSYPTFPITPKGDKISIKTTDERHYGERAEIESPDNFADTFALALKKSLEKVNDLQVHADELTQKMVFNPNSVDAHEVMIAAEKARMALTFTKTIADGVVKAYRDLMNLR